MDESEWNRQQDLGSRLDTIISFGSNAVLPRPDWDNAAIEAYDLALNAPDFKKTVIALGAMAAATSPRFHSWTRYKELIDEVVNYVIEARRKDDLSK